MKMDTTIKVPYPPTTTQALVARFRRRFWERVFVAILSRADIKNAQESVDAADWAVKQWDNRFNPLFKPEESK